MNFTVLSTPNDSPIKDDKSTPTATNFGGHREHSNVAKEQDYTSRTGKAPNVKKNPVDETSKDVDEMTEAESRKREFSRREETSNVQKSNEAGFITKSDPDNRPRMNEGSDAVQVPESYDRKQLKKANRWQYDSSNRYEGEIS